MKAEKKPRKPAAPPADAPVVRPMADVNSLAKLFECTTAYIQMLANKGVVVKAERGKYDLWASIKGYIKFLRDTADKSSGSPEMDKLKTRHQAAKTEIAEIELELLRGDAHKGDLVREFVGGMIVTAKTKFRSVPNKGAAQTEGLSLIEREAVLSNLVEEALTALSEFNPSEITNRYIAQHHAVPGVDGAVGAASEADAEPVG